MSDPRPGPKATTPPTVNVVPVPGAPFVWMEALLRMRAGRFVRRRAHQRPMYLFVAPVAIMHTMAVGETWVGETSARTGPHLLLVNAPEPGLKVIGDLICVRFDDDTIIPGWWDEDDVDAADWEECRVEHVLPDLSLVVTLPPGLARLPAEPPHLDTCGHYLCPEAPCRGGATCNWTIEARAGAPACTCGAVAAEPVVVEGVPLTFTPVRLPMSIPIEAFRVTAGASLLLSDAEIEARAADADQAAGEGRVYQGDGASGVLDEPAPARVPSLEESWARALARYETHRGACVGCGAATFRLAAARYAELQRVYVAGDVVQLCTTCGLWLFHSTPSALRTEFMQEGVRRGRTTFHLVVKEDGSGLRGVGGEGSPEALAIALARTQLDQTTRLDIPDVPLPELLTEPQVARFVELATKPDVLAEPHPLDVGDGPPPGS